MWHSCQESNKFKINPLKRFNMELTFKTSEQKFNGVPAYEVEFTATSDFNLHIERKSGGYFFVYQKAVSSGKYAIVDNLGWQNGKDVIDLDFVGAVYPKFIKVISESEPTMGVVNFSE